MQSILHDFKCYIISVQNLEYLGPHFIQVGVCTKALKQMVSSIETLSGSSN